MTSSIKKKKKKKNTKLLCTDAYHQRYSCWMFLTMTLKEVPILPGEFPTSIFLVAEHSNYGVKAFYTAGRSIFTIRVLLVIISAISLECHDLVMFLFKF